MDVGVGSGLFKVRLGGGWWMMTSGDSSIVGDVSGQMEKYFTNLDLPEISKNFYKNHHLG